MRVVVTDQTGHPDRLPVLHRNSRPKQPLIECRRVDVSGDRRSDVADFLGDIERDKTARIDSRRHHHDDAGVAIIDAVHDGRIGRDRALLALRQHRDLFADLQPRRFIVENHDLRRRQNLHLRHAGEQVDDFANAVGQHETRKRRR